MGKERGQERVLKGARKGFERHKKLHIAIFGDLERARKDRCLFPDLSCFFSPLCSFIHPYFGILGKNGKKGRQNLKGKERKELFPVSFPFPFLPFLSWHMPSLCVDSKGGQKCLQRYVLG